MRRRPIQIEKLEIRRLLVSDWQNPLRIRDVNADQHVTALDALLGINRLNTQSSANLPATRGTSDAFFDVNGDETHTPIDILLIINALNSGPLLDARLANDTGNGQGASADRITNDFSIRGTIQGDAADFILGQLDGQGPWVDLTSFSNASRQLSIPGAELERAFSKTLADGSHRLQLSARVRSTPVELADRVEVPFTVDRTPPAARLLSDIVMTQADLIEIPLGEPLSAASINLSRVSLYDGTWGEESATTAWSETSGPRITLQPRSVTLSTDGSRLVIVPPQNSRSIKYLVELSEAVEDLAGNPVTPPTTSTGLIRAHYFSPSPAQLGFDSIVRTPLSGAPTAPEFQFTLDTADRLIWSGNLEVGAYVRTELYDSRGELVTTWYSDPTLVFPVPDSSAVIDLAAGSYRLRMVSPPVNAIKFRLLRESQLPTLPTSRDATNIDNWPFDVVRAQLTADELVSIRALNTPTGGNSQPLPMRAVFDAYGHKLLPQSIFSTEQLLTSPAAGTYIFLLHRQAFTVNRSPLIQRTLNVGQWVEGIQLQPGERINFTFASTPAELLRLEVSDTPATVQFIGGQGVIDYRTFFASQGFSGQLMVGLASSASTPANLRFRLKRADESSPLIFGIAQTVPAVGEQIYTIQQTASDEVMRISGSVKPQLYRYDLETPSLVFIGEELTRPLPPGRYYLIVRAADGAAADATWEANLTDVSWQSASLTSGPTRLNFPTGYERYEFTWDAIAGQTLRIEQLLARSARPNIQVINPNGQAISIRPYDVVGWSVPYSGTYRLQITSDTLLTEDFVFRVDSSLVATPLPQNQWTQVTLPPSERLIYSFTATDEPFWLRLCDTTAFNAVWTVTKTDLDMVAQGVLSAATDIEVNLESGNNYLLFLGGNGSIDFLWSIPQVTQSNLALDQTVSGTLSQLGDRMTLAVPLAKGQAIRGEQWSIGTGIEARFLDLPLAIDNGQPIWRANQSGTYHLELRNRLTQPAKYTIQLIDLQLNFAVEGLTGFDTVIEGEVSTGLSSEQLITITRNTVFMIDVLSSPNLEIGMQLVGPTGKLLFAGEMKDTPLLIAPLTGVYKVLLNYAGPTNGSGVYAFQCLTPSLTAVSAPDLVADKSLAPYSAQFFRFAVDDGQETLLAYNPSFTNDLPLAAGSMVTLPWRGFVIVRAIDPYGQGSTARVALKAAYHVAQLNSVVTFNATYGHKQLISFDVPASTPYWVEPLETQGVVQFGTVLDDRLQVIERGANGYLRTTAGRVFAILSSFRGIEENFELRLIVHTSITTTHEMSLGTAWQTTLVTAGDVASISIDLSADKPILFLRQTTWLRYTMISPTGRHTPLDDAILRLPLIESGTYKFEVYAIANNVSLALKFIDMDSLPVETRSTVSGSFTAAEPFSIIRLAGNAGERRRIVLQSGDVRSIVALDRWNNQLLDNPQLPADGQVWMLYAGNGSYTFNIESPKLLTSSGKWNEWNVGRFAGLDDEHVFHFTTNAAGRVLFEIESGSNSYILVDPFKNPILRLRSPSQIMAVTAQSDYELHLFSIDSFNSNYRWRISYVETASGPTTRHHTQTSQLGEIIAPLLADDGFDEWLIEVPVVFGQLLAIDTFKVDVRNTVQFRMLSAGEDSSATSTEWTRLDAFGTARAVRVSGRLQLLITGSGQSHIRLFDLLATLPLVLNAEQAVTLVLGQRVVAWSVPVEVSKELQFTKLNSSLAGRWTLLNRSGVVVERVGANDRYSVVSPQRLILVWEPIEAATVTDSVNLRVDSL